MVDDTTQTHIHRAIAFEKAAEGLSDNPWLSPVMQSAAQHVRASAIEQGRVTPQQWDEQKAAMLQVSEAQGDTVSSSDTTQTEEPIDEWAIAALSRIYGGQIGFEKRMGKMPDLDARHPGKMMAFLDVHRKIEGEDDRLSDWAERIHKGLADQGVEPDEDFAREVQAQYDQFQAMAEAEIEEDAPLDPLSTIDAASHPHAEVIDSQADLLVSRTANAALGWLYHIGANRYESGTNTFDWDPESEQLVIEGEISLHAQRNGEQWQDLGSEVDEAFTQRLESHLQSEISSTPSKSNKAR